MKTLLIVIGVAAAVLLLSALRMAWICAKVKGRAEDAEL